MAVWQSLTSCRKLLESGRCHPFRRPLRGSSQWQESTKQNLRLSNHPVDACHSKPGRCQFLQTGVEQCRSKRPLAGRDGVVAVTRSRIGWQVAVSPQGGGSLPGQDSLNTGETWP